MAWALASPPACGDALDDGVEQFLPARDHHHLCAAARELLGGGLADARRCAGQQDALAGEVDGITAAPQRLFGQCRSHAGQQQTLGQPAQRTLAHDNEFRWPTF